LIQLSKVFLSVQRLMSLLPTQRFIVW